MSRGIQGYGAYVPRARLPRPAIQEALSWLSQGKRRAAGQRSYCRWDEDSLTMAVDAARDCLVFETVPRPDAIWLASTTLPFADRSNSGLLAAALGLAPACRTLDSSGSLRAGTGALLAALETKVNALVVASDARLAKPGSAQELSYGHGSAAIAVGSEALLAEYVAGESSATDFVDHYREANRPFDYTLEERWIRDEGYLKLVPDVVDTVLKRAGVEASAISHFVLPATAGIARSLVQSCGFKPESIRDALHEHCGDIGTAHPLLMLADTLAVAAPGDWLLLVGFGHGVDVLLFKATEAVMTARAAASNPYHRGAAGSLAAGQVVSAYTRYLSQSGLLEIDFGMRGERDARTAQSAAYRKRADITAFTGGRCEHCGTVQFPRANVCVNPDCRLPGEQAEQRLADRVGKVKSFTEDWLAYSPDPPLIYGNVDIGSGGNVFMEFTDLAAGELEVGSPVRMVFRIKDIDRLRGFRRYFWKAVPLGEGFGD